MQCRARARLFEVMTSPVTLRQRLRLNSAVVQIVFFCGFVILLVSPISIPDPLELGVHLSWTAICLLFALLILAPALYRQWPRSELDWPLAIYLAAVVGNLATSLDRSLTILWILNIAAQVGVFAATMTLARQEPRLPRAVLVFLVADIAVLLLMATAYHAELGFVVRPKGYLSPAGWSGYPELGALGVVQFALLVAAIYTSRRRADALIGGLLLLVAAVEIVFLYARGAWAAAIAVLAVAALLLTARGHLKRFVAIACVIAGVTLVFAPRNPMLRRLMFNDKTADASIDIAPPQMRLDIWTRTLDMIRNRPLRGVGLGNFSKEFERGYSRQLIYEGRSSQHAHNLWLHQYAELGVIGGTAYLVLWVCVFRVAWRTARSAPTFVSVGLVLAITALLATNVTTNMFSTTGLAAGRLHSLTWLLFGLAVSQRVVRPSLHETGASADADTSIVA